MLIPGDDLSSQKLVLQVLSAPVVLTTVFGMGTGGTPPIWSPGNCEPKSVYVEAGVHIGWFKSTDFGVLSKCKPSVDWNS